MPLYHKRYVLAFSVLCASAAAPAAADDSMEFSLDEAEAPAAAAGTRAGDGAEAQASEQAPDVDAQVAKALGELRWGMGTKELLATLKARMRAEYEQRIAKERDIVRQDALYQQARARYEALKRSFVVFDGKKTGWDVSPLAPEFRHKSHEAMLVVKGEGARDHYFFINDRLWKWYRELDPSATDFEATSHAMQAELGPATLEELPRAEGTPALPTAHWDGADTRVSVLGRGAMTCVVYESRRTLDALAILRKDAATRGPRRNSVLEGVLMDADARESWRQSQDTTRSPVDATLARRARAGG